MLPISSPVVVVQNRSDAALAGTPDSQPLELAIPFTNMLSVQQSIDHAEHLCSGLNAFIRVIRIVRVPYPLDLEHPPVTQASVVSQLSALSSSLPLRIEIWLAREWIPTLLTAMPSDALVLMTYRHRIWRTKEENVACALKRAGCQVSMIQQVEGHRD
jgi:hypothetical protein